jgi:hypothetical protein
VKAGCLAGIRTVDVGYEERHPSEHRAVKCTSISIRPRSHLAELLLEASYVAMASVTRRHSQRTIEQSSRWTYR